MAKVSSLPDHVLDLGRRLIPRPVFLLGCARSGTSILGEALAAHPQVLYLFELKLWNELAVEADDHRLDERAASPELAEAVYRKLAGAAAGAGGKVLVEKNPKHVLRIPFLDALFPWGRFLHLVRDGRDTVASLMFRNRGQRWGHLKVPGWRELLREYPEKNHIRCAHQWRRAVLAARNDAAQLEPGRYLEVRYEDLVLEPGPVVRRVLSFLDLEAAAEVEAFLPRIQDRTAGSYHARKQVRHYVENHTRRIGRYRENLTAREQEEVVAACGDLLRLYGYLDPPGPAAPGGLENSGGPAS